MSAEDPSPLTFPHIPILSNKPIAPAQTLDNLDALAEVHPLILYHLQSLIPVKLLQLNRTYHTLLSSVIYENLSLDAKSVRGVLLDLEKESEVGQNDEKDEDGHLGRSRRFKLASLSYVKTLHILDWKAALALSDLALRLSNPEIKSATSFGSPPWSSNTSASVSTIITANTLFPNVEHLHFGFDLLYHHYKVFYVYPSIRYLHNYEFTNATGDEDEARSTTVDGVNKAWTDILLCLAENMCPKEITVDLDLRMTNKNIALYEKLLGGVLKAFCERKSLRAAERFIIDVNSQSPMNAIPILPRIVFPGNSANPTSSLFIFRFRQSESEYNIKATVQSIREHYFETINSPKAKFAIYQIAKTDSRAMITQLEVSELGIKSKHKPRVDGIPSVLDLVQVYDVRLLDGKEITI